MEQAIEPLSDKENQLTPSTIKMEESSFQFELIEDTERDETRVIDENGLKEFISDSFARKGFISGEKWEKDLNIQAQVVNYDEEYVECDCLMDKENLYFECRSFPRFIFGKIENINKFPFIILNIKSKPGSIRFDVSDGEKRVDKSLFELKKQWDNLGSSKLGDLLDKPIDI